MLTWCVVARCGVVLGVVVRVSVAVLREWRLALAVGVLALVARVCVGLRIDVVLVLVVGSVCSEIGRAHV